MFIKWRFVLGGLCAFAAWQARYIHWTAVAPTGWLLFQVLYYSANTVPGHSLFDSLAYGKSASYQCLAFVGFVGTAWVIARKHKERWLDAVGMLCLVNSLAFIVQRVMGWHPNGLFGNESMSACLIAFTYPILLCTPKRWRMRSLPSAILLLVLPPIAIIIAGKIVPILAAAAGIIGLAARHRTTLYLALASLLASPLLFVPHISALASGRPNFWRIAMQWWWDNDHHIMGVGPGAARFMLRVMQTETGISYKGYESKPWLIWMHNDFIEIVFELGIVGAVLSLPFLIATARASTREKWLTGTVSGIAVTMFLNFPLHQSVHAFLIACVVMMCHVTPPNYPEHQQHD